MGLELIRNQELEEKLKKPLLMDYLEEYFSQLEINERSIGTYKRSLRQFFKFLFENNINSPTKTDVLNFKKYIQASKRPTTSQTYLIVVKSFFKWLENENIFYDITKGIKGVKVSREYKKDYLTPNQMKIILNFPLVDEKSHRDYALILLMVTGGLRTIEVSRANIEDFRTLGDKTVLYLQGKGKNDKSDFLIIPYQVEKVIRDYLKYKKNLSNSDPLFSSLSNNNKGKRMTPRSISTIVKTKLKEAGFDSDRLTAHSLRHTAVTLSLLNGNSLQEVQAFARHKNISTTQIYAHNIEMTKNRCSNSIVTSILD